jgi:hypothetical protein
MFWEKHSHLGYSNRTKTKLCQDKDSNNIRVCMWALWDIVETLVYIHVVMLLCCYVEILSFFIVFEAHKIQLNRRTR